jgi:hypothetical protein
MPKLIACTSCQTHVRSDERVCPHCGAALVKDGRLGRTASAVVMGLTIAGCGPEAGDENASAAMSASGTSDGTTDTGGSGSTTATAGTGSGAHESSVSISEGTWGEPDYGVPDTGWYEETDTTTGSESTGSTGDTDATSSTGDDATEGDPGDDDGPIEPLYGIGDSSR